MRINLAIPERHVKAPVLNGALEAVTRLNESLLKSGDSPTDLQLIEAGARWRPEPPGDEHFDHGGVIAARGHGDCDDWAPLRAARLRVTGEDPGARAVVRKSGPSRWHATVIRSDGTEDDPSLDAGMPGAGRRAGVHGAWLPVMFQRQSGVNGTYIATPQLALRPFMDRHGQVESWQARADLPWHWQPGKSPADVAMVTLHQSPVPDQAIVGAVMGAFDLGLASGFTDPENLKRMSAIAEACEGAPWEDIAERYGEEHATAASAVVGSFFGKAFKKLGKIAKGAVKLASPLAKGALSFVPGGSLAVSAFNAASPLLKHSVMTQAHAPPDQRQQPLQIVHAAPAPASYQAPVQHVMQQPAAAPAAQSSLPPGWSALPPGWVAQQPAATGPAPGVAWPR